MAADGHRMERMYDARVGARQDHVLGVRGARGWSCAHRGRESPRLWAMAAPILFSRGNRMNRMHRANPRRGGTIERGVKTHGRRGSIPPSNLLRSWRRSLRALGSLATLFGVMLPSTRRASRRGRRKLGLGSSSAAAVVTAALIVGRDEDRDLGSRPGRSLRCVSRAGEVAWMLRRASMVVSLARGLSLRLGCRSALQTLGFMFCLPARVHRRPSSFVRAARVGAFESCRDDDDARGRALPRMPQRMPKPS